MIGDPGDLGGKEPGIEGVIDRARAGDAEPGLDMAMSIPGQSRHPVAALDAAAGERAGQLQGTAMDFGIGGAMTAAFDRASHHARAPVIQRGMVEKAMHPHRPVLHQSAHGTSVIFIII